MENDLGFDTYREIYCNATVNFNKFKIHCDYLIKANNDWNDGNVKISIKKKYKNKKGKKFWKEYIIKYNYKHKDKCELKMSNNTLNILDYLNLDRNIFNMKMLGIMINNLIVNTKEKCDNERSYEEMIIDCSELEENNNIIIKYEDL
jgi:hypothetical protein